MSRTIANKHTDITVNTFSMLRWVDFPIFLVLTPEYKRMKEFKLTEIDNNYKHQFLWHSILHQLMHEILGWAVPYSSQPFIKLCSIDWFSSPACRTSVGKQKEAALKLVMVNETTKIYSIVNVLKEAANEHY